MNQRDVTNETSTLWSVDAIESIAFIQASNLEAFKNATISRIGNNYDPTKVYVLWGCVNSTPGGSTYTISAGAVFFGGEIYTVDAVTLTSIADTAVGTMTITPTGGILFSDGTTKDILLFRKFVIADGVSGSGTADFSDWVTMGNRFVGTHDANIAGGSIFNTSTWTNFDASLSFTTPNDGVTRKWRIIFKSWAQSISIPTAEYCSTQFALYNGGNSGTQLDYGTFAIQRVANSTSDYFSRSTVVLIWEGSLAPGSVISVMGKNFASFDPCDFANNKLLAEEVK